MENKLELKHLACYLPYGLRFCSDMDEIEGNPKINKQWTCNGISFLFGDYCLNTLESSDAYPIKFVKPILRPLSDLTKNSYHFIYDRESDLESIYKLLELDVESRFQEWYSYEFWSLLFENNFDVFGLLEKGLAISVHDID